MYVNLSWQTNPFLSFGLMYYDFIPFSNRAMEQHAFKNVNSCLNTNIYSYLETTAGESYNPY